MSLLNIPDHILIEEGNQIDSITDWGGSNTPFDYELDLRRPDIAAWYFGDCAGELVFIPSEPEYDNNGQPITSEMIGYGEEGVEIWNSTIHQ